MIDSLAKQIRAQILDSIQVKQALLADEVVHTQLAVLVEACADALSRGGKILFAGNGGSFADAQHLAAEFASRLRRDRAPLASLALGTNNSSISAIANDYGYEQVFARELECIANGDDVFIPISTSGNSPNILAAIAAAARLNITTVGLTGQAGGKMAAACECIRAPSTDTAHIQECHIVLGHILCGLVESAYSEKTGGIHE